MYFGFFVTKPGLSVPLATVLSICMVTWINKKYITGSILTILVFGILFLTTGHVIDKDNNKIKKITYKAF